RSGPVFITRTGRPLDRSNIWRMLKKLALAAKVRAKKVFPHNLRHLFAVTYYKRYKDVVRLADILGHSSIETTRIYTARSIHEQKRRIETLGLIV
ncbi:MAG: tyrosine-type recombinase/integrase, partial [Subdoligranulum sp.]|nr:tyrosine-type recombinase/integrase [Subdoligranulum sp.]